MHAGADPGFPVGGGTDPRGGAPTYNFVKFSEKLHEIEIILGAPPKSATGTALVRNPVQFKSLLGVTLRS